MDPRTLGIVLIVLVVLLPMWVVALQGEGPTESVELDQQSEIRPAEGLIETPTKLSPSQVGVVVWVALLALVGVMSAVHRGMHRLGRTARERPRTRTDGGQQADQLDAVNENDLESALYDEYAWLETSDRWIISAEAPSESTTGLAAVLVTAMGAVACATLFTLEYVGPARTQYFGLFAFGLFVSLAALTAAYYIWFVPRIEVAERREH
jgi:hypothetical protein